MVPKVCASRWQDNRELAGRVAGRGYSLVLIGIRLGTVKPYIAADRVNNAFANPYQEVSPELVRL